MALRPRAVITTPYPSPAATARVLGVSPKRYRELRAMVTEYLERHGSSRALARREKARQGKRSAKAQIAARRRATNPYS
jgi:uncharacterized protein YdaU (DUF1376 family)